MKLYKAQAIAGGLAEVPDLLIEATEPFPATSNREEYRELQQAQAVEIASRLQKSLPGGVWDRLVAEMVRRHACELAIVPVQHR